MAQTPLRPPPKVRVPAHLFEPLPSFNDPPAIANKAGNFDDDVREEMRKIEASLKPFLVNSMHTEPVGHFDESKRHLSTATNVIPSPPSKYEKDFGSQESTTSTHLMYDQNSSRSFIPPRVNDLSTNLSAATLGRVPAHDYNDNLNPSLKNGDIIEATYSPGFDRSKLPPPSSSLLQEMYGLKSSTIQSKLSPSRAMCDVVGPEGQKKGVEGMMFGLDTASEVAMKRAKQQEYKRQLDHLVHSRTSSSPSSNSIVAHTDARTNQHSPSLNERFNRSSKSNHTEVNEILPSAKNLGGIEEKELERMARRQKQMEYRLKLDEQVKAKSHHNVSPASFNDSKHQSLYGHKTPTTDHYYEENFNGNINPHNQFIQQENYNLGSEQQMHDQMQNQNVTFNRFPHGVMEIESELNSLNEWQNKDPKPSHPFAPSVMQSHSKTYTPIDERTGSFSQEYRSNPPAAQYMTGVGVQSSIHQPSSDFRDESTEKVDVKGNRQSPTKARTRLINDVYGSTTPILGHDSAYVKDSWKPSGNNVDMRKKASIAEQRRELEKQIAEAKSRKDEEDMKRKLQDEEDERRVRAELQALGLEEKRLKDLKRAQLYEEQAATRALQDAKAVEVLSRKGKKALPAKGDVHNSPPGSPPRLAPHEVNVFKRVEANYSQPHAGDTIASSIHRDTQPMPNLTRYVDVDHFHRQQQQYQQPQVQQLHQGEGQRRLQGEIFPTNHSIDSSYSAAYMGPNEPYIQRAARETQFSDTADVNLLHGHDLTSPEEVDNFLAQWQHQVNNSRRALEGRDHLQNFPEGFHAFPQSNQNIVPHARLRSHLNSREFDVGVPQFDNNTSLHFDSVEVNAPEASFVSESRLVSADPWESSGLLASLGGASRPSLQRSPRVSRNETASHSYRAPKSQNYPPLEEQSLTSDSMLMYLGHRTPIKSSDVSQSIVIQEVGRNTVSLEASMHSPLSNLVNDSNIKKAKHLILSPGVESDSTISRISPAIPSIGLGLGILTTPERIPSAGRSIHSSKSKSKSSGGMTFHDIGNDVDRRDEEEEEIIVIEHNNESLGLGDDHMRDNEDDMELPLETNTSSSFKVHTPSKVEREELTNTQFQKFNTSSSSFHSSPPSSSSLSHQSSQQPPNAAPISRWNISPSSAVILTQQLQEIGGSEVSDSNIDDSSLERYETDFDSDVEA